MTESSVQDPPELEVRKPIAPPRVEHDLAWGRPIEDRGFEAVETTGGLIAGLVVGSFVAGPIGAAVGGVAGAAGGFLAGEALERHVGRVAETTDATDADA
jgi:uncharacterized protein YcfJ